jgi:hypothetical protein
VVVRRGGRVHRFCERHWWAYAFVWIATIPFRATWYDFIDHPEDLKLWRDRGVQDDETTIQ